MDSASLLHASQWHLRGAAKTVGRKMAGASRYRAELLSHEHWSRAQMRRWQARQLAATLRAAAASVRFYAGQPTPRTDDPTEVFDVLQRWPVIDKEQVREAGDALCSSRLQLKFPAYSSGSTGSPMRTWRTPRSIAWEHALIERQLLWAGWRRGDRRVWMRGDHVVPLSATSPPFWRWNAGEGMLMCSSFHLSEDSAASYVKAIERSDPVVIQAYPSSIAYLARWMNERGRRYWGESLRGIVTSSERVTHGIKQACLTAFGVPVFDWYGQSERVAAIGTCPHGRYHVIEDAGFVEFQPLPSGHHAVVGTSFVNRAMPLIRYATGDEVQLSDDHGDCACGMPFRTVDFILGRETDVIVTSNGRHHVMPDFVFDGLPMLKEAQFVQRELDVVEIHLVLAPGAQLEAMDVVRRRALERLGRGVAVRLLQVGTLERNASGKLPLIVNHMMTRNVDAQ
jgi:phenylacetate-CoA ligase